MIRQFFFLMKNHSIQLFIVFCPNSVPIWNRCLKPNTQKIRSECEEDNVAFLFYVLRAFLFLCLCLIALFNCNIIVSLFFLSSNFLIKHYWFMWRVRFRIHFKFIFVHLQFHIQGPPTLVVFFNFDILGT